MSDIKYGLISKTDAQTIENTLDLICQEFPDVEEILKTCEVGLYSGLTSKAICDYLFYKKRRINAHIGIDNGKDGELMTNFPDSARFINMSSSEAYKHIPDNSQHFIFIDANHSFPYVVSDIFCYEEKVKIGGYLLFHDTGEHIKQFTGYQLGDKNSPDSYISVRRALKRTGLLDDELYGWRKIFDEADIEDEMGGICVFKKYK